MRVQQSKIQKGKTAAHATQGLLIFVAGCITLSIFTKAGSTDGRTRYFFALCFLTLPGLIYLVAVPMWSRTVRFASAYAFAAVDLIYSFLWFAAFIAVATWNSDGMKAGAKEANVDSGNCSTFAYGNELKCNLSKATVGFGVVICVLFICTAVISFYYVTVFRRTGVLVGAEGNGEPGAEPANYFGGSTAYEAASKHDDEVWSSNTQDIETASSHYDHHDANDFAGAHHDAPPVPPLPAGGAANAAAIYTPLVDGRDTEEGRHPGHPLSWGEDHYGNDHPAYRTSPAPESQAFHLAPSALSPPNAYDEYRPKNYTFNS